MKNLLIFIVMCCITVKLTAQCGQTEIIVICDMTQIDYDNNATPDGIINLFDEYFNQTGITLTGDYWEDPGFNSWFSKL